MIKLIKRNKRLITWALLAAAVLITGLCCIPREFPGTGFLESLYITLRLFMFEKDLPSFPKTIPLVIIHFLAPLMTVSAVGTAISRFLLQAPLFRFMFLRDHVIICGVGKTGKLLAEALRKSGVKVAGIDSGGLDDFSGWASENSIKMLHGDFHSVELLRKARIDTARSSVFSSGNDLANIEGAFKAYEVFKENPGPPRLIWTHIADDHLAETMRVSVRTGKGISIRIFDAYQIAAAGVMANYIDHEALRNSGEITIIGFGKFGHDLLEELLQSGKLGPSAAINIIDRKDRALKLRMI